MGLGNTLKEYAKLARTFNMALTAMGPVFGAMAMHMFDPFRLLLLFMLGCGAHIFGFVLNDYMDIRFDEVTDELSQRPLISGTITPRKALTFTIFGLLLMMGIGLYLVWSDPLLPMLILILAATSSVVYNLVSKKAPGMDIFVAGAVGLLALFGSASVSMDLSVLAYIIALLAFFQVMFMNIVAGGLKDIDHDYKVGGRNLALAMGCRTRPPSGDRAPGKEDGAVPGAPELQIPLGFKALAHMLEAIFITFVLLPFILDQGPLGDFPFFSLQMPAVLVLGGVMFLVSTKLMAQETFVRTRMRKLIGAHYALNFSLVPIMLSTINPWIALFVFIPPVGFALANLALHGSAGAPETM